jgi:pyruvate, orthophosphate dikinase
MPGMMETVLNVGLTSKTIPGLIAKTGNERFVYDAYRRLIMMYADVVMEKAEGIEPKPKARASASSSTRCMDEVKNEEGLQASDTDLTAEDLKELVREFKAKRQGSARQALPGRPHGAALGRHRRVFKSWNGKRAVSYRRIEGIPDEWGTAVNVQAMVFGNMGDTPPPAWPSPATRPPARTSSTASGSSTPRARTWWPASAPQPDQRRHQERAEQAPAESLERRRCPKLYKSSTPSARKLEKHYRDMQDIEFTIRKASCTCCSAASASAPAPPPRTWPWTCSRRS